VAASAINEKETWTLMRVTWFPWPNPIVNRPVTTCRR
jgi:hypothetical protein